MSIAGRLICLRWLPSCAGTPSTIYMSLTCPTVELPAFCIGWLSPDRRLAQVEPLGVASEHRRLGLGAALLAACLERMHTFGAQLVYVLTDNNRGPALELYESLGFRAQELVQVYRRDIGG